MNLPFTTTNVIHAIIIIAIFIVAGWLVTFIAKKYLIKWAKKSKTELDDMLVKRIRPPFSYIVWFIGIKVALRPLNLDFEIVDKIVNSIILIVVIYALVVVADILVKGVFEKIAKKTDSTLDDALLPLVDKTLSAVIILIGFMWVLDVWSIDIAPILASLGIAGLALGFAVKDSLANVFGGISLILDRTIKVGDKVKLESGETGNIIDMGLRSTKLRTFDNEVLTIPNGQLANSRIQNYAGPDPSIRVVVGFGVGYGSKVENVKSVVQNVLNSLEDIMQEPAPEVIFISMEDYYLNFSARFWVADYGDQWKKKLEITEKIYNTLNEHKIDIPFPTHSVYLENNTPKTF